MVVETARAHHLTDISAFRDYSLVTNCLESEDLHTFFYQHNIFMLSKSFNFTNKATAFEKALKWSYNSIPRGVFYKKERKSCGDKLDVLASNPSSQQPVMKKNITEIVNKFMHG